MNPGERKRRLAALRREHQQFQVEFLAEADRVNPATASEQEVQALDAKAMRGNEILDQIRLLSSSHELRRELESSHELMAKASTAHELALWQGLVEELQMYVDLAQAREMLVRHRRQRQLAIAGIVVGVVGALVMAWRSWS